MKWKAEYTHGFKTGTRLEFFFRFSALVKCKSTHINYAIKAQNDVNHKEKNIVIVHTGPRKSHGINLCETDFNFVKKLCW